MLRINIKFSLAFHARLLWIAALAARLKLRQAKLTPIPVRVEPGWTLSIYHNPGRAATRASLSNH
jgi:hypothetical protein